MVVTNKQNVNTKKRITNKLTKQYQIEVNVNVSVQKMKTASLVYQFFYIYYLILFWMRIAHSP